jgi:ABC-type branched-subunit amino acid transport system ATPase component
VAKLKRHPLCVLIAGPNGAGKTTFARRKLPEDAGVIHFVNADLIASGLSPLKPELAAIAAARTVLREIDRLAVERADFAFETTFSGLTYVRRLQAWKQAGYRRFRPCTTIIGEKSVKAKRRTKASRPQSFAAGVGRALRRAAKDAQKTARMYGTPLYVWENGKVVAKKP